MLGSREETRMLKRSILSAFAVGAVALALAGCALFPGATSATAKPAVGQCWNTTLDDAQNWATWGGAGPVACSATHSTYTFAVVKLGGSLPKDWATSSSNPQVTASLATKVSKACGSAFSKFLPALKWNQSLIQSFFFMPSQADWKAGAHWARCDVGALAYGTTLQKEALAPLPSKATTLVGDVKSHPAKYELCITTTAPASETGPLDDPDGVIADCRADPQWKLALEGPLPGNATAAYPTGTALSTGVNQICAKSVDGPDQTWSAYPPSESDWKSGDRTVDCWVTSNDYGAGQQA